MGKDVKQVKQTYKEFLSEVRAKQFGWVVEEPTPLGNEVAKVVTSETSDKTEKTDAKPKTTRKRTTKKTEESE